MEMMRLVYHLSPVDFTRPEGRDYDASEEETLGLQRIEREIEQMREIDSRLD